MNIALNGVALAVMQASTGDEAASGGLTALFSSTPWIDIVGLGIVAFFLIRGLSTGLIWQIALLVGVGISITVARKFAPDFTPRIQEITDLPLQACQGIVWFMIFTGTLMTAAFVGKLARNAVEAAQLGPLDRLGGALAGTLTGAIVHCALLVLLTSIGTEGWTVKTFKGSASASMLDNLSRKQHLLLDAQAAERIVGEWGRVHDEEIYAEHKRQVEKDAEERRLHEEEQRRLKAEDLRRLQRLHSGSGDGQPGRGLR